MIDADELDAIYNTNHWRGRVVNNTPRAPSGDHT